MEEKLQDSLSLTSLSIASSRRSPIAKSSSVTRDSDLLNSSDGADRSSVSSDDLDFSDTADSSAGELSVSDGEVQQDHTASRVQSSETVAGDSDLQIPTPRTTVGTTRPGQAQRRLPGMHEGRQRSADPMPKRPSHVTDDTAELSSLSSLTESMGACSLDSTLDTLASQGEHSVSPTAKGTVSSTKVVLTVTQLPKHTPVPLPTKQSANYRHVSLAGPTRTPKKDSSGVTHSATSGVTHSATSTAGELTPWQLWLLKKTTQQRESREVKHKQEIAAQNKVTVDQKTMTVQQEKAEKAWHDWCERKALEEEKTKLQAQQSYLDEARRKEKKRQQAEERGKEAFHGWVEEKAEEQSRQKSLELRRQEEKEENMARRRSRADKVFTEWRAGADRRLSKERRQEMFDVLRAPLSPSYCNPLPWQPTLVTKKKIRKRKLVTR